MLDRVIQLKPQLQKRGFAIAAVTQGQPGEAKLFCQSRIPGLHCLADPRRLAYRAYRLGRIDVLKTLFSKPGRRSRAEARAHGHRQDATPRGQSTLQTAGVFVVGTDGRIRFAHYYESAGDHPDFEKVVPIAGDA
jgi:hypothetical protein